MAIQNRQIGWSQESNLLWQILKQINKLTSVIFGLKEAATPKYKVYTALLSQTGTDAPVATVLENTIGGIVWTYIGPGEYQGTLFGEFPINKTFVIIGGPFSGGNNGYCFAGYYDINGVVVYSAGGPNKILDAGNNILEFTPIEIRVYN